MYNNGDSLDSHGRKKKLTHNSLINQICVRVHMDKLQTIRLDQHFLWIPPLSGGLELKCYKSNHIVSSQCRKCGAVRNKAG